MNKLAKRSREALNDKGFSLIELIIVIAIMAALVAILAPQYLKYVEKSRTTADNSTADEILSACKISAADPDVALPDGTYYITWDGTAALAYTGSTAPATYTAAVNAAVGALPAIKSSSHTSYVVKVVVGSGKIDATGGWSAVTPEETT